MKTWMTISVLSTFDLADQYRRDMIATHLAHGSDITDYAKVQRLAGERFAVKIGRESDPAIAACIGPDLAGSPAALAILRWSCTAWDPDDLGSSGDPPDWQVNPSGEE